MTPFIARVLAALGLFRRGKMMTIVVPHEIQDVHTIRVYTASETVFVGVELTDRTGQRYRLSNDVFGGGRTAQTS